MAATQVTVTGTLQSAPGVPARGNLQWQLSNTIFDSSGVVIGDTAPRGVTRDSNGHFSITVWANDDATTTPTGTYYTVTGLVDGQAFSQKYVISHTQAPSIDLIRPYVGVGRTALGSGSTVALSGSGADGGTVAQSGATGDVQLLELIP